jgi:hypothetical protein
VVREANLDLAALISDMARNGSPAVGFDTRAPITNAKRAGARPALGQERKIKIKIKVKSRGQECPRHPS